MGVSLSSGLWIVVGLLSVTAVAAFVLLVTMLFGRRASHHVTGLSFIVSVLAHLALLCGWFAWYLWTELHPGIKAAAAAEVPPREVVKLTQILPEADDAVTQESAGNTPLAQMTEATLPPELNRLETPIEAPAALPEPQRERMEQPTTAVEVTEAPSQPEIPQSIPRPSEAGETGPLVESRIPLSVEDPTRESRPEVEIPATPIERTPLPTVAQLDANIQRNTSVGSVNRVEIEVAPKMATPDLMVESLAPLKRVENSFDLAEQTGPTPSSLKLPDLGTDVETPDEKGKPGQSVVEEMTRTKLSEPIGLPMASLDRMRPNFAPALPSPNREGFEVSPGTPSLELPSVGMAAPNVLTPNFDAPLAPSKGLPQTYRLRSIERRAEIAQKFGGTQESERAVEASLAWLAAHQELAGNWDANKHGAGNGPQEDVANLDFGSEEKTREMRELRRTSGIHCDTGVTALALLSFLAAGYTNEEGKYAENIDRAIRFLIKQQREDGYLGGQATYFAQNYCHGMSTYALAEALGMQSDLNGYPELREAVKNGVNYTLRMQLTADGGWRYNSTSLEGDMSLFGWQLMALKSAEIAGINIPESSRNRMIKFLRDRSLGDKKGLAAYRPAEKHSPSMTAEALFCKQILGIRRTNGQSVEAVEYLLQHLPKRSEWNLYYWYYGTLAVYQYGGPEWETWNDSMRDTLVQSQRTTGDEAGSWDPVGPWGPYGGRIYSTALATLCLEVYYRFLPLYEHGGKFDE